MRFILEMYKRLGILLIWLFYGFISYGQVQGKQKLPNIIFIAVDDLKPLLHCYGENQMVTPNFDRLAKMGTIFTNAHVQQAVCGPSRASVMTSTYPDRNKVWDLQTDFRESSPDLISMPEYLKNLGYHNSAIGKIYHNNSSSPNHDGNSWSEPYYYMPPFFRPVYGSPPFAYWVDPKISVIRDSIFDIAAEAGITDPEKKMDFAMKRYRPSTECVDLPDTAYQDGLFAEEAVRRLKDQPASGQPFFLSVGFIKPHLPFNAPEKYWDLYKREEIPLAAFRKLGKGVPLISYKTLWELNAYTDIDSTIKLGQELPEFKQKELIHGYMACVSYIDAQLGKILDEVERQGLLENTMIVLWGDHGYHLGDHAQWCKHSNLEQATRIPLMLAGKNIPADLKIEDAVELIDLFPTLFDLAGIQGPDQCQGASLKPLMNRDPLISDKGAALSQFHRSDKIMGYSVRTRQYRYTEWRKYAEPYKKMGTQQSYEVVGTELYDYQKDPDETQNFFGDPSYTEIEKKLSELLYLKIGKSQYKK